jgi:hypothetical protein
MTDAKKILEDLYIEKFIWEQKIDRIKTDIVHLELIVQEKEAKSELNTQAA